jgi:very-short-patch-repair endonuclease/Cdc6-like AAA superfamily ATPase
MNEATPRVLGLLTYIEQVEKLKTKPAFSVPTEYFVAYQHELRGLPELQFNLQVEGDDVWLRVPRLREIPAPEVDETLKPWITLPKSPEKSPELKTEYVTLEGKREVSREQLKDHTEIKELFDWYVENQWEPWAAAERPRRKTIARYNQLFALQQAISSEGAETPIELVWGIGYASWKKEGFGTPVKHPLLVQSCEITLNAKSFDLEIRPRDVEPRLEADCYAEMELPGVRALDAFWKSTLATGAHRVNPFESSTFEGVLKAAVGHLDPSGTYEVRSEELTPPAPADHLKITNTWVLFGRKRSGDIFLEDIRRLKKSVEMASALPGVIRSFVEHGDDTVRMKPEQPFRGLSSSDSPSGAFELYFPMAYNDEQVSIVQKLESNDGVVVQGPPGTGKTHTIANVICHYLAQGKRVLVTAKGESALAVLQEKLPERIRPLSVSLLSDERDGMKQFEHSIQTIASSVASLNPARAASAIAAAEAKLNQLHAKIAHVDQTVTVFAEKHMRNYTFQGREVTPEEMAKLVLEQAEEHEWFDDEPPATKDGKLGFDDSDISALRQARLKVGTDLGYLNSSLPAPDEFPTWQDLVGLHRDLIKARAIEANVTEGSVLALVDSQFETFEKAQNLVLFLDERDAIKTKLAGISQPWIENLHKRLADMQPDDPLWHALQQVCTDVRTFEGTRRELLAKAIELPAGAELHEDFNDALLRLVAGKSAFALPFGKGEARKLVQAVKVLGIAPSSKEDWTLVERTAAWRVEVRKVLARWNSMSEEFGLEHAEEGLEAAFKGVVQAKIHIEDVHRLVFEFDAKLHERILEVFGRLMADRMWDEGEPFLTAVWSSLQAHVDKGRLAYAMKRVQDLLKKLEGRNGVIVDELRTFLIESLGHSAVDEAALQTTWGTRQSELTRLVSQRPWLDVINRVSSLLEAAGALKWAKRVRTEPATPDLDLMTPSKWLEAWNWRQAVMFLERIDGHNKLRELFDERKTLTTALARTYQELVAEKTWLGVFNNSPDSVRQALQAYLNAVQSMGAGTGVRAIRHRKTAREAMVRAYQAVPCWVLPQWRVSETIPPEVGLFDLVVIDEASQSDIWALPALLRGKKLLVVGDHKQVSPSAVGTAEEKIKELSTRFLSNQPHGAQMTPDKSIYDLARVVFAGNSVMLKEHFRCVPAIIEFSNREFYEGDIKPLRLPKANERLDPPLIDVYVKGGYRKVDVNPAEAEAIVNEIDAILADEQFNGRTIGVVTLLGTAQAAHIQELVSTRISPADVLARKIAVGPPPVFQGRERDIMMVSMVLAPGDRAAQNKADMYQRFNVALSRARDRTYLFRSVTETTFKEDTLNARLIQHFRQPFRQDGQKVQALREKCESGFELEMFDELVKRGYRVQPQVPCGGYRIDFVVEGNEGRRLAIECDGDRFHGPGQWADDMARQRVLERAGWTFWRCFASSFVRRREEVLADLLQTLERLGIAPLGAESVDNTVWVHTKEVDPYGVEEEQADEQEVTQ